jgi:hypothetical protein
VAVAFLVLAWRQVQSAQRRGTLRMRSKAALAICLVGGIVGAAVVAVLVTTGRTAVLWILFAVWAVVAISAASVRSRSR